MIEGLTKINDKVFFDFLRRKKADWTKKPSARLTQQEVNEGNAVLLEPDVIVVAPEAVAPEALASKKPAITALVGTLAATVLLTAVPQFEGTEYKAYKDVAGIWTVCTGDTTSVSPGLIETPEGCRQRLDTQLVIHAKGVTACTPNLKREGRDYQLAAAVSLAYNIGVGAYCRSSVDRYFDKDDYVKGCDSFLLWNKARVNGVVRPVSGLTSRRQQERNICLKGLV